jgi:uncharacterized protein (TIGR01244 family)
LTAVSLSGSVAEDTPKAGREAIMKKKLEHAQKLLEGIAIRDFELIEKHADSLVLVSKKAEFLAFKTPDYTMYSDDFRRNAERAARMAREKNVDGAALAYVQLTMNCVNCHKHVREIRMAKHDPAESLVAMTTLPLFGQQKKEKEKLPKTQKLEKYECGTVERIHTLGGVFLASQPNSDDFKLAKEGGIKTVINLREKNELGWDEEAHVKKLGMAYHNLPFKTPAQLTDDVFDTARKVLRDESNKPILLHCGSGNRVGAIWLTHRVLDHGLTIEEALKEAETIGLRLPAFREKAKDYVARNKQ